jgi:hypothetical protein
MTGDLIAGLLLAQIIYWHLPSKNKKSKLRVKKGDRYYLVKRYSDWWDEIRLTEKRYRRAIKILTNLRIVETELHRFNGFLTVHIWLNQERFIELFNQAISFSYKGDETETAKRDEIYSYQKNETLTKTTHRLQTVNTVHPPSVPPIQGGNDHPSDDLRLSLTQTPKNKKTPMMKVDSDKVIKPLFKGENECNRERIRQKQALEAKLGYKI